MNNDEQYFTDAQRLRIRAEAELKKKQSKMSMPEQEADLKKLLHELQVHQIELELQNEELREAYETAEEALKKYTVLYDFAPVGYFTLEPDGSILDLNFTGSEMLGERRFSLINSNFRLFVANDSKMEFDKFFSKIFAGGKKETCEVMLGYDNIPLCPVYIEGIVTGENQKCLLSVIDISGFKKKSKT